MTPDDDNRAAAREVGRWYATRLRPKLVSAARDDRLATLRAAELEREMHRLLGPDAMPSPDRRR